jgi:tetraacyldisaccharide 4'-kinase
MQRTRPLDYIRALVIRGSLAPMALALLRRTVSRRLRVPDGVQVVAIGGATLGGSGKTPLAIACARELASAGARVALVGHAYRARPGRARVVSPGDGLDDVGDEALLAARALASVPVVVGPSRQAAIARAAEVADVLVMDGVAQLAPGRAALALLAVDAEDPWGGAPALLPRGSLRAPLSMLLEACDAVAPLGEGSGEGSGAGLAVELAIEGAVGRPLDRWPSVIAPPAVFAWGHEGGVLTWEAIRERRVGLLTAMARPERMVRSLARLGVRPAVTISVRDHGAFRGRARRRVQRVDRDGSVDLWLASPKCVLHLDRDMPGIHVAVVSHEVTLHPLLRKRLRAIAERSEPAVAAP